MCAADAAHEYDERNALDSTRVESPFSENGVYCIGYRCHACLMPRMRQSAAYGYLSSVARDHLEHRCHGEITATNR